MWIWGNGGHAKVVRSWVMSQWLSLPKTVDDNDPMFPWKEEYSGDEGIVAIGDNRARRSVVQRLSESQRYVNFGTVTLHGSIIQDGTILGRHVIINTGATVDHDCKVGDFVHVAPGAHLCGDVTVGEGAFIGAGTIVTPGSKIEPWAFIKAGSLVTPEKIVARL